MRTEPASSVGGPEGREFAFSDRDFERVRELIHARAGIALNDTKKSMVYSRLSRRLRERALQSFSSYLDLLESDGRGEEWQSFVNALTTNLTSFFREAHHFEQLGEHLRTVARGAREILVWSAACSTGEEPYSILICAHEALGGRPNLRLLCTDIDTSVLETARRGVYKEESIAGLEDSRIRRWFQRGTGENGGLVRVRPELRDLATFRQLNLHLPNWPLRRRYHAVFLRNVMIYFEKDVQRQILERLHPLLDPQGLLFLGHSESLHWCRDLFEPAGRTVYRPAGSA